MVKISATWTLFLGLTVPAAIAGAAPVDDQVWTDTSVIVPLDEARQWNLTLTTILRATQDASRLTDRRLGVGVSRRLNRHLTLGTALQFRRIGPSISNSTDEDRYFLNATISTRLARRLPLSNRNLLERRNFYPGPDTTIYRNRTQIDFPTRLFNTQISPFIAAEFFYDFRLQEWARSRATLGVTRRFNPCLAADFFVLRQIEGGNGRPGDFRAYGINLRLTP